MRSESLRIVIFVLVVLAIAQREARASDNLPQFVETEHVIEWTFESKKVYADPFNDVDVDIIFSRGRQSWRVPAFWRGDQRWTVRFAPPLPGEYTYRLTSTDVHNPDLNGHEGRLTFASYTGPNDLFRHGMPRVSLNKRYFEYSDGTPFFWLGDTWWTGLSDRLSWEGFQELTTDRKSKGFSVVQIVAGLVPLEDPPSDPGFCNEGGCVWDKDFSHINPQYFDFADRRIRFLLKNGIVPAIVGGWGPILRKIGVIRMQKHWRYIIARYGAYPVFWIVGGEVVDPPESVSKSVPSNWQYLIVRGWTDVARYIRRIDPYHHPLTAHEWVAPLDFPLQDSSLTDFDLIQSGQGPEGPAISTSVAQLNLRSSRTAVTKPIVEGEIGYENHLNAHFVDFQRRAFWISMLNGAAGHTYGADATWGASGGEKPLLTWLPSFRTWREGMVLPGSYEVGLNANLLRRYRWWRFQPHPEWITPRGTTLLEAREDLKGGELGSWLESSAEDTSSFDYPKGEWSARHGNSNKPYAAGIPGEIRVIYIPSPLASPPTVLGLEFGVRYRAYYWEPSLGIRIDLGFVERPSKGEIIFKDELGTDDASHWSRQIVSDVAHDAYIGAETTVSMLSTLVGVNEENVVASVDTSANMDTVLVLRYHDSDSYIAAVYSQKESALYLLDRKNGVDGPMLGKTLVSFRSSRIQLQVEVRDGEGVMSATDGKSTYTTPLVVIDNISIGKIGIIHRSDAASSDLRNFELRRSPDLVRDESLQRKLYDNRGLYRGELVGHDIDLGFQKLDGWDNFGRDKHILLDAYQPPRIPTEGDWILVLEAGSSKLLETLRAH